MAGRGLRNKTANDVFETMKEETIQGCEDVKYINSSRDFAAAVTHRLLVEYRRT